MRNWYSSKEAVQATGATYRQIDHWLRRGYGPSANNGIVGSGYRRELSLRLVVRLAVIKAVTDLGVKPALLGERSFYQLFTTGELQRGPVRVELDLAFIRDRICDRLEGEEHERGLAEASSGRPGFYHQFAEGGPVEYRSRSW